ncbi:MAG: DUF4105 domain-containing protein [Alphaproteobacteria bacterium]|nr:DUF4105 domain-containing protein [Alphaproteobacteria bacterium]
MHYLLFFMALFFSSLASAQESDKAWAALGHYQNGKSSVDSDNFFLSAEGKANPQAELAATIELFAGDDATKQCLFPARFLYLQKRGLTHRKFPKCEEYEQFKADLQPKDVTLLFTDAYMNNPSSMFGHTLLRIDTKRKGTQMLAHGANYGAFTGDEGGAAYALKGLFGLYFGGFTVKPYYDIINTYNNIENRDIWELTLNLSPQELELMVAHLWEIGHTQSRYYFFSRNCSYMLLEMLDALRPELELAKQFDKWVIPLDSFKAVAAKDGLVKALNYRPSRQNKIKHRYKMMSSMQVAEYQKAMESGDYRLSDGLSDAQKADVWETAYQTLQYKWVAKELDLADYRRQSFDVLRARSGYKNQGSIAELDQGKSPLEAHGAKRLAVGAGERNGEFFEKIELRPAYQSLTDNDYGLIRGAQINFLNTELRHYAQQNKLVMQELDVLNIRSMAPIDFNFKPTSFQLDLTMRRWFNPISENEHYVGSFMAGVGGAVDAKEGARFFAYFNNRVGYGGGISHNSYVAASVDAGVLWSLGKWRALLEVEPQVASQKLFTQIGYRGELNYIIATDWSVAASGEFTDVMGKNTQEYALTLRYYF